MSYALHPLAKRPAQLCANLERDYPGILKHIDALRAWLAAQSRAPWPDYAYAPFAVVLRLRDQIAGMWGMVNALRPDRRQPVSDLSISLAGQAVSLAAWRYGGKHILVLHEGVRDALWRAPEIDAPIPADTLTRLPFWGGYLPVGLSCSIQGRPIEVSGILLALLHDETAPLLQLFIDARDDAGDAGFGMALSLDADRSLPEAIAQSAGYQTGLSFQPGDLGDLYARALSLALYLCAEDAERRLVTPPAQAAPPRPATPRRQKLFAPRAETVWAVGWRIGAAIRRAEDAVRDAQSRLSTTTGRSVRPHMRRAHWHGYRVGPGRAGWKTIWLPPVPVNMPPDADSGAWSELLPVTQRRIEGSHEPRA